MTARNLANRYRVDAENFKVETRTKIMAEELYNEVDRIVNAI